MAITWRGIANHQLAFPITTWDINSTLGPILKMQIPGQIRIFNALNNVGYSTGNTLLSGNDGRYNHTGPVLNWYTRKTRSPKDLFTWARWQPRWPLVSFSFPFSFSLSLSLSISLSPSLSLSTSTPRSTIESGWVCHPLLIVSLYTAPVLTWLTNSGLESSGSTWCLWTHGTAAYGK